jgi:hypothetical protein
MGWKHHRWVARLLIACVGLLLVMPQRDLAAQGTTLPAPNLAIVYEPRGATLVNLATTPLSFEGFTLMRAGGVVNYAPSRLAAVLQPAQCVQVRSSDEELPLPPECTKLIRWRKTNRAEWLFWKADYSSEPFRPQFNGSALTICTAGEGRCEVHVPQGGSLTFPWSVLYPRTGVPMPPGMQVAYDANQLWIGHFTAGTVLPTGRDLRLIYKRRDGTPTLWTPADGPWDAPGWDGRGLNAGECLVLYGDPSQITPLLPCTPVAFSPHPDAIWQLAFDVMGPREERRAPCSDGKPLDGAVLCIVGG